MFKHILIPTDGSPLSIPADAILAAARKHKCDLVVMDPHSRRGLRGVLLGSETQKVLARSPVAVLVYRGPRT